MPRDGAGRGAGSTQGFVRAGDDVGNGVGLDAGVGSDQGPLGVTEGQGTAAGDHNDAGADGHGEVEESGVPADDESDEAEEGEGRGGGKAIGDGESGGACGGEHGLVGGAAAEDDLGTLRAEVCGNGDVAVDGPVLFGGAGAGLEIDDGAAVRVDLGALEEGAGFGQARVGEGKAVADGAGLDAEGFEHPDVAFGGVEVLVFGVVPGKGLPAPAASGASPTFGSAAPAGEGGGFAVALEIDDEGEASAAKLPDESRDVGEALEDAGAAEEGAIDGPDVVDAGEGLDDEAVLAGDEEGDARVGVMGAQVVDGGEGEGDVADALPADDEDFLHGVGFMR